MYATKPILCMLLLPVSIQMEPVWKYMREGSGIRSALHGIRKHISFGSLKIAVTIWEMMYPQTNWMLRRRQECTLDFLIATREIFLILNMAGERIAAITP